MTFDEAVTQIQRSDYGMGVKLQTKRQRSKFDNGYGLLRSLTGTNERTAPRTKPLPFNPSDSSRRPSCWPSPPSPSHSRQLTDQHSGPARTGNPSRKENH